MAAEPKMVALTSGATGPPSSRETSTPGTWLGEVPDVPAPRALIARYRETRAAADSRGGLTGSGPASRRPQSLRP